MRSAVIAQLRIFVNAPAPAAPDAGDSGSTVHGADAADRANAKATAWTAERLTPYLDSPLSARAGAVLIAYPG